MMSPASPAIVWRKMVVPMVVLLVLVGVFGVGGYVGSDQAIGNKPEWRKIVHSPAEYNLSSETCVSPESDREHRSRKIPTGTSHAADECRHREARSDSDARMENLAFLRQLD
jgi:hypothetical protein